MKRTDEQQREYNRRYYEQHKDHIRRTIQARRGQHTNRYAKAARGEVSVYSPTASIVITRTFGRCLGICGRRTNLVNGYCDDCRTLGYNEQQVTDPRGIEAKSANGRLGAANSPWRMK